MRQFFITVFLNVIALITFGQKEGRIIYERASQNRIQFTSPSMEHAEISKMFPKVQVTNFELLFGNNQSVWQSLPDINQEANQMSNAEGGRSFTVRSFGGDDVVYYNLEASKKVSSRELSSKKYVIEDTLARYNWKLSEETKTILGFRAMKAVTNVYTKRTIMSMENGELKRKETPDTLRVTAWFTSAIPVAVGPAYQGQLPGAILELDINNGQTVYKAIEFSPRVNLASIKEPKGGKKVSQMEFEKELQTAAEQTRRRVSESGGHIMISQ